MSFLLRIIILNIVVLPATLSIYSDQYNAIDAAIFLIALAYAVFYIYLPRLRDAAIPAWLLIFAIIPFIDKIFSILLLFKASVINWKSPETEETEQDAAANP